MFTKILIANRGEIACRVIDTARWMGVRTVALYSDADARARHVEMADQAVHVGPPPVAESYLQADRIIEAALKTGAQAIHPGYGFLSENPDFVEKIEAAGLTFIGPPASAIRAMGLKDAAKALMEEAGVPVVPGYHGDNQDPAFLAAEAEKIGYPVLIKARAGGGGKGMRRVDRPQDFASALEGAQREGQASFGDPSCLIEKWVTTPRHIEIQVFGDSHGNVVHLFERDCSLQRRHQKVIEEAPAPGMTPEMRAAMGEAAVQAAKAIGYTGAGTIEFIVDASEGLTKNAFYFMEMNTRLQVEHPVTEAITGLDLVEWQLRVASGEPLPLTQADLGISGHAFEARIYAEDAAGGFLPATGILDHVAFPPGVRADTGVRSGDAISPYFDPMIAKLITHGPTREIALNRLTQALADCEAVGLVTNLDFLRALTLHEGFAAGDVDTGLIERDLEALTRATTAPEAPALAALTALGYCAPQAVGVFAALGPWRLSGPASQQVTLSADGTEMAVDVLSHSRMRHQASVGGEFLDIALTIRGDGVTLTCNGIEATAKTHRFGNRIAVQIGAARQNFILADPLKVAASEAAGGDNVVAPMSGLIKKLSVTAGAAVAAGQPLAVMEAMKMEHTLTAPRDGDVAEVLVSEGAQVAEASVLIRLVSLDD